MRLKGSKAIRFFQDFFPLSFCCDAHCVYAQMCVVWLTLKIVGDGEWEWIWLSVPRTSRLHLPLHFKIMTEPHVD